MEKQELLQITGGAFQLNGTVLGYVYKIANSIMDIGRSLGSAIRRAIGGTMCPI